MNDKKIALLYSVLLGVLFAIIVYVSFVVNNDINWQDDHKIITVWIVCSILISVITYFIFKVPSKHQRLNTTVEEFGSPIAKTFTKQDLLLFEKIWVEFNVNKNYGIEKKLPDDQYIKYKMWEEKYWSQMYKKHLPDVTVIRGNNPNLIFHGGCLGCKSQQIYGLDRCKKCQYFKADWSKPDLSKSDLSIN